MKEALNQEHFNSQLLVIQERDSFYCILVYDNYCIVYRIVYRNLSLRAPYSKQADLQALTPCLNASSHSQAPAPKRLFCSNSHLRFFAH